MCATDEEEKCLAKPIFFKLSVLKWNPHIDGPTKSIYLGLVGIDELTSTECGAILLGSLEGAMKDRPSTTVDEFLQAIHSFNNDQGVEPVDPREEGTYVEDDEDKDKVAEESARQQHLRREQFQYI